MIKAPTRITFLRLRNAAVCMFLVAFLTAHALADQVSGAEKVSLGDVFGWWLPATGPEPKPAVIGLHGCGGLYARGDLNARERGLAQLLRSRGFHILLPDSFTPRGLRELCTTPVAERTLRAAERRSDIQGALDWLAARREVDRTRIVVIGWSHGGSALLAALNHRIGVQPLQARAAVAFYPGCTPYARTEGSYLPVAPLLILIGALDDLTPPAPCVELGKWTPKVSVVVLPGSHHGFDHPSSQVRSHALARDRAYAALFEFLERELR
jgi:dienelactone hydrolase